MEYLSAMVAFEFDNVNRLYYLIGLMMFVVSYNFDANEPGTIDRVIAVFSVSDLLNRI